ncbi:flavin-containing monooxygenase [Xylariaceae sp. FL1272]|nr:flavin-containing monooxygenase [Xylariaceae sp. FL1272]
MAAAPRKRVVIIGGGLSGLCSLKECLAEGFETELLESRPEIGGQWAYQSDPDSLEGEVVSSVCDFPFDPARYGDYFGHRQFLEYIREYVDHFNLHDHIRLRTKAISCVLNADETWTVTIQQDGHDSTEGIYNAVFAATGANTIPSIPAFKGRELFEGEFLHSQVYRKPGRFENKKIAIIGLGSAAVDIASELTPGSSEVHMITRRGGWIMPRYVLGKPIEAWDNRATQVWVPSKISQALQTVLLNTVQGKLPKELQPEHAILEQNPTIRSEFVERVRNGSINVHRTNIDSFTSTGLKLENGTQLDVDVIICCTGFSHSMPYLPADVVRAPDTPPNTVDLYKLMIPVRYRNLFLVGFVEVPGAAPPTSEAQARMAVSVLTGRIKLPEGQHLANEVKKWQEWQAKSFVRSERHSITTDYVPYIDSLLAPLGANPTVGKLFGQVFTSGSPWKALQALNAVFFGITSSAQWRLCGYGSDPKSARETVLRIASGKDEFTAEEKKYLESTT